MRVQKIADGFESEGIKAPVNLPVSRIFPPGPFAKPLGVDGSRPVQRLRRQGE
jgi:hypothetical protein